MDPLIESLATPLGDGRLVILGGLPWTGRILQLDDVQTIGVGVGAVTTQHLTAELDEVIDVVLLEDDKEDIEVLDGVDSRQGQPIRVAGADADEVKTTGHNVSLVVSNVASGRARNHLVAQRLKSLLGIPVRQRS